MINYTLLKKCPDCGKIYNRCTNQATSRSCYCLICQKKITWKKKQKYRNKPVIKEKILNYAKEYRRCSENKKKTKKYLQKYRQEKKEILKENDKKYRGTLEYKKKRRKYLKKRSKKHIYKLEKNLRKSVWRYIRQKEGKHLKTKNLVGCSFEHLKKHLESQFQPKMSWNNYGKLGWHVDHIIPCASFDLTDPEQQKKCFNYTNLQPLWARDNLRKKDKLISYPKLPIKGKL